MQTVSNAWKENHQRTLVNEGFVEVSLDITDPDALSDASTTDNGAVYISNTAQVVSEVDKSIVPYLTLEQNMWVLDGTRKVVPNGDIEDCGYIGDVLSDSNCGYSGKIPTITVSFSEVHNNIIPAITIVWGTAYDEYPEEFIITAYNGTNVVASKEVLGNHSVSSVVMMDIVGYDRITIQIKKWCLPNRRARIHEIFIGLNKVFTKSDLFGYSHSQTVEPLSTTLPKAEVSFSISNVDGEYNPFNTAGMAKYLMERQEVKTRYGLKHNDNSIEWIKGGTFYLSDWSASQNGLQAEFTARDLLEFMQNIYEDGEYNADGVSLYDLALRVLTTADLPLNSDGTIKWKIDDSLKNIYTTAPLPEDTLANCLQLIANAGCCVLYQDREGTLHIEPITHEDADYEISDFNSYSKSEITLGKPVKQVSVAVYTYSVGEDGITAETVSNITTVGTTGDTITLDNPLITDDNRAAIVGEWMADYYSRRMTIKSSWRADVRLDALDIISNPNDYSTNMVRVTNVEFDFKGAFHGTCEGRVI